MDTAHTKITTSITSAPAVAPGPMHQVLLDLADFALGMVARPRAQALREHELQLAKLHSRIEALAATAGSDHYLLDSADSLITACGHFLFSMQAGRDDLRLRWEAAIGLHAPYVRADAGAAMEIRKVS